jgi:hypothetical protein
MMTSKSTSYRLHYPMGSILAHHLGLPRSKILSDPNTVPLELAYQHALKECSFRFLFFGEVAAHNLRNLETIPL